MPLFDLVMIKKIFLFDESKYFGVGIFLAQRKNPNTKL